MSNYSKTNLFKSKSLQDRREWIRRPRIIKFRNLRLAVWQSGIASGPPMVYLHGGPGYHCFDFLYFTATHFENHLHLVAFDQYGCGKSSRLNPEEVFGLDDLAEHLEVVRRTLDIKSWSLLGHSFGSTIAIRFAERYPHRTNRLILVEPITNIARCLKALLFHCVDFFKRRDDHDSVELLSKFDFENPASLNMKNIQVFMDRIKPYRDLIYLYSSLRTIREKTIENIAIKASMYSKEAFDNDGRLFTSLLSNPENNFFLDGRLSNIVAPTLIVVGRYDPVVTVPMAERITQAIPESRLFIMEYSAHHPYLEEAKRFANTIIGFLNEK